MSDIAILNEMIKQVATVPLIDHKNQKKVVLEEKEDNPDLKKELNKKANYSIEIQGLPDRDNAIIINVDYSFKCFDCGKNMPQTTIFNGKQGECKRSDFIIIADLKPKKVIVFIELKAGNPGKQGIIEQFKGAQCFVRYCQDIGRSFWNENNFLQDYEYRFVAILDICNSIRKRPTSEKERKVLNNTPEKMLPIKNRKEVYFRELI